jgi:hypothetical protein
MKLADNTKKSIKSILLKLWDFYRHKKSYAQDGEDVVIDAFISDKPRKKGFFVDIGAHHPVRFSNTHLFSSRGWKGINVDPTPGSMRYFNLMRPRDINLEIGIGETPSTINFYCFNEPALNTFDAELAKERNTGKPHRIVKTLLIDILPLKDVFKAYLPKNQHIDFMSVDVEGFDLQVLRSNDWNLYRPTYLLVEVFDFSIENPKKSTLFQFINSIGYTSVAVLKRTLIFVDTQRPHHPEETFA